MKRLIAIYFATILACSTVAYANLASSLRADTTLCQWGYYNGDRNWVWVYSGLNTSNCLYRIENGRVTSLSIFFLQGYTIGPATVARSLTLALDRNGQQWHALGPFNWRTNDGRLAASHRLVGGMDTLVIWYTGTSQPVIKSRPKGKPKHSQGELLPPVQEQ
jgi:hypothetical protein